MIDSIFLLFIALILLTTKVFSLFMRRIHLPQVVGALLAGVLLGPSVFGMIEPNEMISELASLGVIFLLFSAGMETDLKQLRSTAKSSIVISLIGIILSLGGGFAAAFLFGNTSFESFFIGVVIASMSTSITVEALQEMGKLKTKSGTAIMGASLFDDIIVIVMLAILMGVGDGGVSVASVGMILLRIIIFFAVAVVAGFGVSKLFNYMFEKAGAKRRLSIFAIAYCFFMAYLAEVFGLADITGAFIAGIAFCNTKCVQYLDTRTHELSYLFFTPLFMANIGIQTSFAGMTGNMVIFSLVLVAVAILAKLIGCGLGARLCGFSKRESLQVGTGMTARGEVSFIVAAKGIAAGYIGSMFFPPIIVVVILTTFIAPFLLRLAYGGVDDAGVGAENPK